MKLEEMLSQANELFGVNLDVLNAKISEQVISTILDKIDTASKKVLNTQVTQEFAIAEVELDVVADYNFVVLKYQNLIHFATSLGENAETYAKDNVKTRLELAKEKLKEFEKLYEGYEVPKNDNVKEEAMRIALKTVKESTSFLNTILKMIGDKVKEKERKPVRVEQRAEPTQVPRSRTAVENDKLEYKGLTARVGAGAVSSQKTRIKGKSVLCFDINGQEYYRINDIADMFGTTRSALQQYLSTSVEEKERERLKKEGKIKPIVYNGKRNNVYSVSAFETILPKKYRSVIKDTLAKFTPTPASQEEYNVVGEERSIDTVIEKRSKGEKVVRREEGERIEQPVSQVPQVEDSDVVINYFVYRGKNYYTGPNAARVLGVKYSQIGIVMNTKSVKNLIELEAQGKLKGFKREKGMALKTYREDILLELVPEKLRKGIDVQKRLKKLNTEEYDGKYKAITLADTGVSVEGYRPQPSTTQNGDNGVAAKVKPRPAKTPERAEEGVEKRIRTKRTIAPPVEQPETPEAFKSSLPENLKDILSAKGLEQTVEGAETLYFLAINGQRYFSMSEVKKVYETKEYDGRVVNPNAFSVYIIQRSKQGRFPDGSLLKLKVLGGFQERKSSAETYFVREDVVHVVIPDYVTDKFTDLIGSYSLAAYPLEYVDTDSFVAELKRYNLGNGLTQKGNGKKNGQETDRAQGLSSVEKLLEERSLETAVGTTEGSQTTSQEQDPNALIPYDDLPNRLGYSMANIDAARELLVNDGKLKLEPMIPDLGDGSPMGIRSQELEVLTAFLKG